MVGAPGTYNEFEHTVAKYAECEWAGAGWPLYRADESIDVTVKRVMPDVDWVINKEVCEPIQTNKPYKVGHFTSDLQGKYLYSLLNIS